MSDEGPMRALLPSLLVSACFVPEGHQRSGPLFVPPVLEACSPVSGRVGCPGASDELLQTPHAGFNSFYRANPQQPAGAPPGSVAYVRFWWSELEPVEGQLDVERLEQEFAPARAAGQQFAFRIMAEETGGATARLPKWMVDQGLGQWGTREGARSYAPDTNSPRYLAAVERTLAALGARYADDPALDHVEVGFVGNAAEWSYTIDQLAMPTAESTRRLIEAHRRAFPKVPVVMMIGSVDDGAEPLETGLAMGTGWRADCWGDLRRGWNHHDQFYDRQLDAADAGQQWKTAPVMLETCGVMQDWDVMGMSDDQLRWLLGWALDRHVSQVNNKSTPVPRRWRALVDEFQRSLGARLLVHRVEASREADGWRLVVLLANRGVAPFHSSLRLAVRTHANGADSSPRELLTELGWVVDQQRLETTVQGEGPLSVEVSLVTPDGRPAPLLANVGRQADGWLSVLDLP